MDEETELELKINIDNSLDLGWKRDDIIFASNFNYEYNGVKSLLVDDSLFCKFSPPASKINVIIDLIDRNLINEPVWFHDIDAFQLEQISDEEINVTNIAVVTFGKMKGLGAAIMYFTKDARDIFGWIKDVVYKYKTDEEKAMVLIYGKPQRLWSRGTKYYGKTLKGFTIEDNPGLYNIKDRIKIINYRYGFNDFFYEGAYRLAKKPIKVMHFHPLRRDKYFTFENHNFYDMFAKGKNTLGVKFLNDRIIRIFNKHGII